MIYKTKKLGFTIIELLVVIAVISLLASIVLQSLNSARVKARNSQRLITVDQIHKAFEVAVAGVSNQSVPTVGWACLGSVTTGCNGTTQVNVDNILKAGMGGGIIPKDPKFTTGIGSSYLYNSNLVGVTVSGDCTAGACPDGAYLSWVMEDVGLPTSQICGSGKYWGNTANGPQCLLRVGDLN